MAGPLCLGAACWTTSKDHSVAPEAAVFGRSAPSAPSVPPPFPAVPPPPRWAAIPCPDIQFWKSSSLRQRV